jgi:phage-related protein
VAVIDDQSKAALTLVVGRNPEEGDELVHLVCLPIHIDGYLYCGWRSESRPLGRIVAEGFAYLPPEVRLDVGFALNAAQKGETDPAAKPLKGFGGHAVMEIVAPFDGNTWRTVYTVRFRNFVYVLHAFQKKSKSGIATPKTEMELIHQRLAAAERRYKERQN